MTPGARKLTAFSTAVADYEWLAGTFNPQKFDAKAWVALARLAGMKYITSTGRALQLTQLKDGITITLPADRESPDGIVALTRR